MNRFTVCSFFTLLPLFCFLASAAELLDEFVPDAIDRNNWTVSLPISRSAVVAANGRAVLIARGGLKPNEVFEAPLEIRGRFRFSGSRDQFRIGFRSDLEVFPPAEPTGVFVGFRQDDNTVGIAEAGVRFVGNRKFTFQLNVDYDFRITDDGNRIEVFIGDLAVPVVAAATAYRTGNRLIIYNSENSTARTEIDFLQIIGRSGIGLDRATFKEGSFRVDASGTLGAAFQIEASTDLKNWVLVANFVGGTQHYQFVDNNSAKHPHRFYRLREIGLPPSILVQPASQSVTAGSTVSLSVEAAGSTPLFYQWRFGRTTLAGETNATLTMTGIQKDQAGGYMVTVTNAAGIATSSTAVIDVRVPTAPIIAVHPAAQKVNVGESIMLSVSASGDAPLTYQWKKDGADVPGATSSTLAIQNAQTASAGSYAVVVSNPWGAVTSQTALVTVVQSVVPPTITAQPLSQSVSSGTQVSFSVSVTGTAPFTYQWKLNGVNVSGATSATYTISSALAQHAGIYTVEIRNAAGAVTSSGAALIVSSGALAPASITGKTIRVTILRGSDPFAELGAYMFVAAASGNSYLIIPLTDDVGPSSGTYTYTRTNNTSATLVAIDSEVGRVTTQLTFITANAGTFVNTAAGAAGMQSGNFLIE